MNVIKVIPISKGISKEYLSYFTSANVTPGSIASVPLRKKVVSALVMESEKAVDLKSELKNSDFALKKIEELSSEAFLSPNFIESAKKTAEYFATTTGAVLNTLIPNGILESVDKLKTPSVTPEVSLPGIEKGSAPDESPTPNNRPTGEKFILQADDDERFANYKSLIREQFAKKSSVFFCVPTLEDIKKAKEILEKGIERFTFVLHGSLKKKEVVDIWNSILNEPHQVLIIATGSFFCLPRADIGAVIVERENSRSYKNPSRPFLDFRTFAEIFSKISGCKLVLGDNLLRTETIWRQKNGEFLEFAPLKFRSLTTAECVLVDMKKDQLEAKKPFKLISRELEELLGSLKENNQSLFIFGARRGLAPSIVCGDCGQIVTCKSCHSPTVLHSSSDKTSKEDNYFLCHRCGEKRSAYEKCLNCGSWELNTLGIGIEKIEEQIKKNFPSIKTFQITKDSALTHKKALDIAEKFYASPGSVLLGTEMALFYLNKKIENSAVVSMDSLFSIPDFRINEKVMYILLKLRSISQNKVLLQTRTDDQTVFDYALRGNLIDFYRKEVEERKKFDYPPMSTLIKITLSGKKEAVEKEMEKLKETLAFEDISVYPAFAPIVKGKYVINALIKIKPSKWPNKELLNKLLSLPPQYLVKVDPESIL